MLVHARFYVLGLAVAVCGSRELTDRDLAAERFARVWRGEHALPEGCELCAICAERVTGRDGMVGGAVRGRR